MRMSTIVLAGALLSVSGVTVWLGTQLQGERAQNAALRRDIAAVQMELRFATSAAEKREHPVNRENPPALAIKAGATPLAPRPAQASDRTDPAARLIKNPEFQKALRAQQRASIEFLYQDLPKTFGLTPEKAALVFDQLTEQVMQGFLSAPPAEKLAVEAKLDELLGYDSARRLDEFRDSLPSRNEVGSLRASLANAGQSLRDDQVAPLTAIVRAQQTRLQQQIQRHRETDPVEGYDTRTVTLMNAANLEILEQARPLLTEAQFAALEAHYRNQRAMSEALAETTRLQIEDQLRDAQAAGLR